MSEDRIAAAERLLGLKVLECDALRAVAELASNIYAISATFEMNPLVKERLEALQTKARQALAGQPELRKEASKLDRGGTSVSEEKE